MLMFPKPGAFPFSFLSELSCLLALILLLSHRLDKIEKESGHSPGTFQAAPSQTLNRVRRTENMKNVCSRGEWAVQEQAYLPTSTRRTFHTQTHSGCLWTVRRDTVFC